MLEENERMTEPIVATEKGLGERFATRLPDADCLGGSSVL